MVNMHLLKAFLYVLSLAAVFCDLTLDRPVALLVMDGTSSLKRAPSREVTIRMNHIPLALIVALSQVLMMRPAPSTANSGRAWRSDCC